MYGEAVPTGIPHKIAFMFKNLIEIKIFIINHVVKILTPLCEYTSHAIDYTSISKTAEFCLMCHFLIPH